MKKTVFISAVAVGCLFNIADGGVKQSLPDEEVCELGAFFKDFVDAINAKDVDRVKLMSGNAWAHFSQSISNVEKAGPIDISDIIIDGETNIVTKAAVIGPQGDVHHEKVVFSMRKEGGRYSILKMTVPAVDKENKEFDDAAEVIKQFMLSVKRKDLDGVKKTLTFGTVEDFDSELSARGLSWIKDAVEQGVIIPGGWGVRRESDMSLTGHIEVPCAPGGTNILREVRFKDLKVDCAAPRKETKEEFLKRFRAERAASRKRFEEQQAELVKQLTEQLRKKKRDRTGAK